jgi:hypothetical protein
MATAAKTPRSNCVMNSAKLAATGIKHDRGPRSDRAGVALVAHRLSFKV